MRWNPDLCHNMYNNKKKKREKNDRRHLRQFIIA